MSRLFFLLIIGACYFCGVILSQITIKKIISLKKKFVSSLKGFISDYKSYQDYLFLPLAIIFGLFLGIILYNYFGNKLQVDNYIQMLIAYSTFLVIFHSVYIRDASSMFRERPIISVEFNYSEPDCHKTTIGGKIPVYYIRFRVNNIGKTTIETAEVILEKVKISGKTLTSFLPLNLTWALTEVQLNRGIVNIPQGMFRTIDLIEIEDPAVITPISINLRNSTDPSEELQGQRLNKHINGIGICSVVKPNTFSDILPFGNYIFYLSVSSDNTPPRFLKFSIDYDGKWSDNLNTMFSTYLKIRLLSQSYNKSDIFD